MLVFAFSLFNLLFRWVEKVGKFDLLFPSAFSKNFKIMYFLMKILENTPSADSAASRDSLSSQNATWGIVFFSSFYWWHIEYKGWMCERLLNLQEIYVSGQNICIEVYGNSVGTIPPPPPQWIAMYACLKIEFTEGDKCHNLMSRLISEQSHEKACSC